MVTRVNETLSKITGTSTKPRNEGRVASQATAMGYLVQWVCFVYDDRESIFCEQGSQPTKANYSPIKIKFE